jgi:hypothetical protein
MGALITNTCPRCAATFDAVDDCLAHVATTHLHIRPIDVTPLGINIGHSTELRATGAGPVVSVAMLVQADNEGMAAYQTLHLDRAVARHLGTILVEETTPDRLAEVDHPEEP